jgi:hypothetical protein
MNQIRKMEKVAGAFFTTDFTDKMVLIYQVSGSDFLIYAMNCREIGDEFRKIIWHFSGPTARQDASPGQRPG